ncbi:alanine--tRNA ligase [Candidatus Gottesmanbacteria bacterium]|nr:alanine--tRNA ligase [Candidatus Gottesmanbacteria bacterium]
MKANDIRKKYIEFFKARGHVEIPSAPLVPENDPTTLFTGNGMQPLVPYLLGQTHPAGKRIVDSQKSFRAQDIEEVGDNRHTTFFEMLGNWSLGDYFKKEQLPWIFEFLTKELGLPQEKLYVSVFEGLPAGRQGTKDVPKDEESAAIWKNLGIPEERIFYYGVDKNWWSRAGEPEKMPSGEPGGPDSEVFFDFQTKHDPKFGKQCHPNCDCGRFLEIANSVFMQYVKKEDGTLAELPNKNVDFGGGLERLIAATNDNPDVFETDLFTSMHRYIEVLSGKKYGENIEETRAMRIVCDHVKAAVMMSSDGVIPSNKTQGYILRRLIRRALLYGRKLGLHKDLTFVKKLVDPVATMYSDAYPDVLAKAPEIAVILEEEALRFDKSLERGLAEIEKTPQLDGKVAFYLYESYGFPWEMTGEIARERGQKVDRDDFEKEFKKHQELSRTAAKGMFTGGLADKSEKTVKLHTAHHLLLAALQKIVDPSIRQRGSNITAQRLRMDFNFGRKITPEELKEVENLVSQKISENLAVTRVEMQRGEAEKIGAQMEFGHKYPDRVSIYFVGPQKSFFSAEFCGGPHVTFTGTLGHFTIVKEEAAGAGIRRIYATLQ